MDIRITGRHVDVGDALRSHVEDRLQTGASKYFDRLLAVNVTISKEGHSFAADCALRAPRGVSLQSHGQGGDAYSAFDDAAEKIEKQLRRYKRRLTNHHAQSDRDGRSLEEAQSYVIAEQEEAAESEQGPIIIAESKTEIPRVSVSDAVMLMDLAGAAALMFRNAGNDHLNVVYRRADGNIGWLDPAPFS